nr:CPPV181 hypothetical protein [Cooks petrelpox virus]
MYLLLSLPSLDTEIIIFSPNRSERVRCYSYLYIQRL